MSFERKIAEQGLEKVVGPEFEPGKDAQGGAIEVRGGTVKPKDRGHKNWGQVINHEFELRSLLTTTTYEAASGAVKVAPGEFGYHVVRAESASLTVFLDIPKGVPFEQKTKSGKNRYRQFSSFLEVYYAQPTKLSFNGFLFGRSGYRLETPEPTEAEPNPKSTLVAMLLDEELGDGVDDPVEANNYRRPAGTSDLFLVSYNERTGGAFAIPLSMGVKNAIDPAVPIDDGADPGEPEEPEDPHPPEPPADGDYGYKDPDTGNDLVPTPPTVGKGVLVALHSDGISHSSDAGATWRHRDLPDIGVATDVAASLAGIFLLTDEGKVFWSREFEGDFAEIDLSRFQPEGGMEVHVVNGDFETGDLEGWEHSLGPVPSVLNTAQPEQRPGSRYYLSRDMRDDTSQLFVVAQTVEVMPEAQSANRLRLSFDALTENQGTIVVGVFDQTTPANIKPSFDLVWNGQQFVGQGFADDGTGGELTLVGQPGGEPGVVWGPVDAWGFTGVQIAGDGDIVGGITWRALRSDGSLFDGLVCLKIFDLDTSSGVREEILASGLVTYDMLESEVEVEEIGGGSVRFRGLPYNVDGDVPESRFHVMFRGECNFQLIGRNMFGIGVQGPDSGWGSDVLVTLIEGMHSGEEWKTVEEEYLGPIPSRLRVDVKFVPTADRGDVFIDNIKLSTIGTSDNTVATAIASIPGKSGGADIYAGDVLVSFIPSALADEKNKPEPLLGPTAGITMAARGGPGLHDGFARIATNGAWAWSQEAEGSPWYRIDMPGPFSSVIAEPYALLARETGEIVDGEDGGYVHAELDAGTTLSTNRRTKTAIATTPGGEIHSIDLYRDPVATEFIRQPSNDAVGARRTLPMDVGRFLGYGVGVRDLFWNDRLGKAATDDAPAAGQAWSFAGGLKKPILKIVEVR